MAASYWESTQMRHWTFTKQQLSGLRRDLENEDLKLVQAFPVPEPRFMNIFFNAQTLKLAKRLQIRQQAIATAQLYIRRFYLGVEIRQTNPYLVLATALYLACKVEESPQHIRHIVTEARGLWPDVFVFDVSRLGECEFYLISEMNSQLIVHHPYRTLEALKDDFAMTQDEATVAWNIINDTYMTDLPLLLAPHTISIMAMLLSLLHRPPSTGTTGTSASLAIKSQQVANINLAAQKAFTNTDQNKSGTPLIAVRPHKEQSKLGKLSAWLAESNVDIEAIVDAIQELLSFYELHEQYNEKLIREQINRFVKAQGLDK